MLSRVFLKKLEILQNENKGNTVQRPPNNIETAKILCYNYFIDFWEIYMKTAKKILLILISAIMMIEGCGCSIFVSERELKQSLENELKKRYHESFTCLDVWGTGGTSYTGECYSDNNRNVVFEASFFSNSRKASLSDDKYASALASKEMSDKLYEQLKNGFSDCFVHAYNYVSTNDTNMEVIDEIIQNKFSLENFLVRESYDNLYVDFVICVNIDAESKLSYADEYTLLNQSIENISHIGKNQGTTISPAYWIYFLPTDVYQKAISYFDYHCIIRTAFNRIVEGENETLNRHIQIDYDEEKQLYDRMTKESISQEDYAEMRKALDQ